MTALTPNRQSGLYRYIYRERYIYIYCTAKRDEFTMVRRRRIRTSFDRAVRRRDVRTVPYGARDKWLLLTEAVLLNAAELPVAEGASDKRVRLRAVPTGAGLDTAQTRNWRRGMKLGSVCVWKTSCHHLLTSSIYGNAGLALSWFMAVWARTFC